MTQEDDRSARPVMPPVRDEPMSTPIPEQKSCFLHGDHAEERCPRCARLPRVCSHGIYHHGCPSCDRQDPEDR